MQVAESCKNKVLNDLKRIMAKMTVLMQCIHDICIDFFSFKLTYSFIVPTFM